MKEPQTDTPPENATLKKPNLIGLSGRAPVSA